MDSDAQGLHGDETLQGATCYCLCLPTAAAPGSQTVKETKAAKERHRRAAHCPPTHRSPPWETQTEEPHLCTKNSEALSGRKNSHTWVCLHTKGGWQSPVPCFGSKGKMALSNCLYPQSSLRTRLNHLGVPLWKDRTPRAFLHTVRP